MSVFVYCVVLPFEFAEEVNIKSVNSSFYTAPNNSCQVLQIIVFTTQKLCVSHKVTYRWFLSVLRQTLTLKVDLNKV